MEKLFPFLFLGAALYLLMRVMQLKLYGVPVRIKVVRQKINWGTEITASPLFEIISGEYLGKTSKSQFGTSFGFHSVGSVHDGVYHPSSGMIESMTTFAILQFFTYALLIVISGYFTWRFIL